MRRLLTHAAVFLPVAFAGPSALAQQNPIEPTRAEMIAIMSGAIIGGAEACGIEASLLDATTEHVFRVVRAKARDDAEFHSAAHYFTSMYTIYGSRRRRFPGNGCGDARPMFDQLDGTLDKAGAN
jgi:hypothetical protein